MPSGKTRFQSDLEPTPSGMTLQSDLSVPLTTAGGDAQKRKWLLRYVLIVATLAFTGRAAPLSFLPLVLQSDFKQSDRIIGVIMAIYPFAALIATPWAAHLARRTRRIVSLHSVALLIIATAMVLTSLAPSISSAFGLGVGVLWIGICRAIQGFGACLYLSSNTSLITRRFPENLPYVIAMTEVAVGSGGQLGRIAGGCLFDLGGFACPFAVIAVMQGLLAVAGFGFEDTTDIDTTAIGQSKPGTDHKRETSKELAASISWRVLVTPRLCVGGLAAFVHYFVGTMFDATGLQYLKVHLAPVSITTLSLLLSIRGLTYLLSSFVIAQVMKAELISFERLLTCGATLGFIAQIAMAPQPFVADSIASLESREVPDRGSLWGLVIFSLIIAQLGGALMFVPSLPLMQSEVTKHGELAIEKAAEGLVTMMTLGEMLGPVWGGWIVGQVGYLQGTLIMAIIVVPFWLATVVTYDGTAVQERRKRRYIMSAAQPEPETRFEDTTVNLCDCAPQCAVQCTTGGPGSMGDGDVSFAVRRQPFVHQVVESRSVFEADPDFRIQTSW